jgi:hypothetical protein
MNFETWFKKNFEYATFGTSIQDEALRCGWDACKQEVLKILKKDWKSSGISINSCDKHYIDKIKEL